MKQHIQREDSSTGCKAKLEPVTILQRSLAAFLIGFKHIPPLLTVRHRMDKRSNSKASALGVSPGWIALRSTDRESAMWRSPKQPD